MAKSEEYFQSCLKKTTAYILLFGLVMIMVCGCSGGKNEISEADLVPKNVPQERLSKDNTTAKEVGNTEKVATVALDLDEDMSEVGVDKMSKLSVEDYGRPNPFLPPTEAVAASRTVASTLPFDLITPPLDDTVDSDANRVIKTKVSGILFDEQNPAAILNMEGMDYLVRTGDVINNYKVLAIYKNNVAVQLGNNIYKAGVGELLATDKIHHNVVPNLDNRFGGSSTTAKLGN